MKLAYKPIVLKQLKKLPQTELKKIFKKLTILSHDPYAGKPLQGELKNMYSLRAWPYRIIYEIKSGTITVYSIAHRQAAYR